MKSRILLSVVQLKSVLFNLLCALISGVAWGKKTSDADLDKEGGLKGGGAWEGGGGAGACI